MKTSAILPFFQKSALELQQASFGLQQSVRPAEALWASLVFGYVGLKQNVLSRCSYRNFLRFYRCHRFHFQNHPVFIHHPLSEPGSKVLYLGAASGTTVSHVADIVGPEGMVYAVEFSHRSVICENF